MNLDRIINLIRRTGDRCVVVDKQTGESFVLMTLDQYEDLLGHEDGAGLMGAGVAGEGALMEAVNRDIALWREAQKKKEGREATPTTPAPTRIVPATVAPPTALASITAEPEIIAEPGMQGVGPKEIAGFSRITFEHLPPKPDPSVLPTDAEEERGSSPGSVDDQEEKVEFKWEPIE